MRKRLGAVTGLLAFACNEVLGLEAGKLENERGGGGSSGSRDEGRGALGANNASGSGGSSGATGASNGGEAGIDGGAGGVPSCSLTADCFEQGLTFPPYLCL